MQRRVRIGLAAVPIWWALAGPASAQDEPDAEPAVWMARADSVYAARPPRTRADSLRFAVRVDSLATVAYAEQTWSGVVATESLLVRSLTVRERLAPPDSAGMLSHLHNLASIAFNIGDADQALTYRQRACAIAERILPCDAPQLAIQRGNLGANLVKVGQPAQALPLLVDACTVLRRAPPGNEAALASVLTSLGELFRIQNRYTDAESCLTQAIPLARASSPEDLPFVLNNLAGVYKDQGRFDAAVPLLRESLLLRQSEDPSDPELLANATLNLAELDRLRGRNDSAGELYAEALRFARQAGPPDSPNLAEFLNQFAVHQRQMQHLDDAERASREALAILEQSGTETLPLAQVLVDRADILRDQGHAASGDSCARAAIDVRARLLGADHPEVAVAMLAQARCLAAGAGTAASAERQLDAAIVQLDAAPAFREPRMDAYALRAALRAERNDRSGAIADMSTALATVELVRPDRGDADARADLVRRTSGYGEQIVGWCLEEGDIQRAFEFIERGRARVFLDQLAAAHVELGVGAPTDLRRAAESRLQNARLLLQGCEHRLDALFASADLGVAARAQLAALAHERDAAAVELRRAEEGVFRASPQWRETVTTSGQPIGIDAVAGTLAPRDGLVLVYSIGEHESWLLVISPRAPTAAYWPLRVDAAETEALGIEPGGLGRAALAEAVASLRLDQAGTTRARGFRLQSNASPGGRIAARRALWRVLVPEPLRDRLLAATEVIVIPDAALHALPFEALVVSETGDGTLRTWLDAGPVVRYAASATSLAEIERAASEPAMDEHRAPPPDRAARGVVGATILCVANPAFSTPDATVPAERNIRPLPGTAREAEAIRNAFGAEAVTVLSGSAATEARVRAALRGPRIVHFATHGIADRSRDALLAGLVLAPGTPPLRAEDDGFLQLFEIYGSQLDCDLAVLSACATSAGTVVQGEGVFALSRGFLAAGAAQVVASLWDVDDASTAALMQAFYRRIATAARNGEALRAALALRDAKREVASTAGWQDPYYWAAFVASGAAAAPAPPHGASR